MVTIPIDIRTARETDADRLADLHATAWRAAYRGIIPGVALEKYVAERDGQYWQRCLQRRHNILVLDFDGEIAGYALCGPVRRRVVPADGEIYELYFDPIYQGLGLGQRLFESAREHLSLKKIKGIVVWVLDDNADATAFYRALDGQSFARTTTTFGGKPFDKTAFIWR